MRILVVRGVRSQKLAPAARIRRIDISIQLV
jgi:hypothetical protein